MFNVNGVGRLIKDAETFNHKDSEGNTRQGLTMFVISDDYPSSNNDAPVTVVKVTKFFGGKLAEYLKKGDQVIFAGRLDVKKGRNNDNNYYTQVIADRIEFGSRGGNHSNNGGSGNGYQSAPADQDPFAGDNGSSFSSNSGFGGGSNEFDGAQY
jgi:single-stranded DNA-binding protein